MRKNPRRRTRRILSRVIAWRALVYALALIWVVITIYPLVFLVQNSLKTQAQFFVGDVWSLPHTLFLGNYLRVWQNHFPLFLWNSVFVVGVSLVILMLAGSLAAFGLSRIRFRLRGFFYYLFIGGLTIPVHITLIPVYIITRQIHIYDTLAALVGPFVAFNLPVAVFILAAFMAEIPLSLEEAGYMDGANRFQVFRSIVLPMSRPAVTAVGIYNAVILWNEFIFPLVLINTQSKRPLTLALWNFQGEFSADVPAMMAALLLSVVPLLILYAIAKERLIEGLVSGAVKG
jgi:raffinose/stachyose/melibiose transport system permease protein